MKNRFLVGVGLWAVVAFSIASAQAESLPELRKAAFLGAGSCDSVIRGDEQRLYIGFGRPGAKGMLHIIDVNHPDNISMVQTQDGVVDVQAVGNRLLALTASTIEEWKLSTLEHVASYPSYQAGFHFNYKEHATGFYLFKNQLFISHGRLGFSVFDLAKNQIVEQHEILAEQKPFESMAIGIAGTGDRAILAVDNFSSPDSHGKEAFRGFLILDLNSRQVIQKGGEMDPGAESINIIGNSVIVGFHPPIWKFNLKNVLSNPKARPDRLIYIFPGVEGYGHQKLFFDEKYMYGCFGTHALKPAVFDRKDLKLD